MVTIFRFSDTVLLSDINYIILHIVKNITLIFQPCCASYNNMQAKRRWGQKGAMKIYLLFRQALSTHLCFFTFCPPNARMSSQLMHFPQFGFIQLAQCSQFLRRRVRRIEALTSSKLRNRSILFLNVHWNMGFLSTV